MENANVEVKDQKKIFEKKFFEKKKFEKKNWKNKFKNLFLKIGSGGRRYVGGRR